MTAAFAALHFLRPAWLLLLLPFVYLLWRLYRHGLGAALWTRICDPALLPYLLVDTAGGQRRLRLAPFVCGGLLAILALAGPTYERLPQPVFRTQSALIILLDLSASMMAQDLTPSRLERARFKVKDLLAARRQGQTALVVFAAQAFTVTPLTDDTGTIGIQLAVLAPDLMPSQGSDVALAIRKGIELATQAGFETGDLLLVTDGVSAAQLAAAQRAVRRQPYRLSILGVGTAAGAPIPIDKGGFVTDANGGIVIAKLDSTRLQALATAGRGYYQGLTADDQDIAALATFWNTRLQRADPAAAAVTAIQWRELGPWLLLPVLACAALAFRRGLLIALLLSLAGGTPRDAAAAGWWLTPDQAGSRTFGRADYAAAAAQFADPAWRAAALYRAGEYAKAVAALKRRSDPDARYNTGNALARLGRYEAAVDAYEQVLKGDPEHADARYNKAILDQLLEEQARQKDQGQPADEQRQDQEQQGRDGGGSGDAQDGMSKNPTRDALQQPMQQGGVTEQNAERSEPSERQERSQAGKDRQHGSATTAGEQSDDAQERAGSAMVPNAAAGEEETQLATEQWLRQIPDDPGGLLRRKFQYQYGRMYGGAAPSDQPW